MKSLFLIFLFFQVQDYPIQKQVDPRLGAVLGDIESHIRETNHQMINWSDLVNCGHESTHLINSHLRSKFGKPAFYCLGGKCWVIERPYITLRQIYSYVPMSMRTDRAYNYLVSQARDWNNEPLYCLDEWIAYTNGTAVKHDLKLWGRGGTTQFMFEFNIFAIALCQAAHNDPKYDHTQLKAFVKWNIERSFKLYDDEAKDILTQWRTNQDCENLREFARGYFGKDWCKQVMGI